MRKKDRSNSQCYHPSNNKIDYTDSLPDECLALIFSFLTTPKDRNNTSLVSHRWLRFEAQTRTHLSLRAKAGLKPSSIFTRFNSLTQLVLSKTNYNNSINDNDIILVTSMCPNLICLILHECRQLTDSGIAVFSKSCKKLKNFSCAGCGFTNIGMAALLDNCSQLEVLSVDRLRYYPDAVAQPNFHAAKNLKRFELTNCGGNWDRSLEMIADNSCLVEVHLDNVKVTDAGISSLSKCRDLISLHICDIKCTNVGLISVAENCKGLKKLYVGYWNIYWSKIGDEGLIAVGKHSANLEVLTLKSVNACGVSLQVIGTNCRKLDRVELERCRRITKAEMMYIAEKCVALRILHIDHKVYKYEAPTEPEPVSTSSSSTGKGDRTMSSMTQRGLVKHLSV